MFGTVVLFLLAAGSVTGALAQTQPPPAVAEVETAGQKAEKLAKTGHYQADLSRLSDARKNCDAALQLDPDNETAKDCLKQVASKVVDQDLDTADARLLSRDKAGAIALASKWAISGATRTQRERAWRIVTRARSLGVRELVSAVPDWLRQSLIAIVTLAVLTLILLAVRKVWSLWERGGRLGVLSTTTKWRMLPLKEMSDAGEMHTGIPTDVTLDALSRLGHELERDLHQPRLLLLRPTPPANHEPAIIDDFLSKNLRDVVLVPAANDLCIQWKLHDIELDQAVRSLQLKAAAGIDIGSVARLMRGVVEWFTSGSPTISGVAHVTNKSVSIHLSASSGGERSASVSALTDAAPGIDPIQLSADRAAFKFLFRMTHPGITNDEIDGFSALRQGATEFLQYARTVTGAGEDASARASSLAHAAFNFGFFRSSIPLRSNPLVNGGEESSLHITDEIRQAALLAEGVALCLGGRARDYMLAIDCFRQLQDWPGSEETLPLRQQAAYNEAIVWRDLNSAGHCVLLLTSLLGERARDTIDPGGAVSAPQPGAQPVPPAAIRIPARLARLAAFARYDRTDWSTLPDQRSEQLIEDAERLVRVLDNLRRQTHLTPHDRRLAGYMYIEALRAIGHVELLRVKTWAEGRLYQNRRPTGLPGGALTDQESARLKTAIEWMLKCEALSPDYDLYCDLSESHLLLKDYVKAQGYARNAILKTAVENERAYYLATESFLLQNVAGSKELAKRYAKEFKGIVKLEEFRFVREELGINEESSTSELGLIHFLWED